MEFTWDPDYFAQKTIEPSVKQIQFGDGYEHRQASGLNYIPQKWALTFKNRDTTEANEIDDFLRTQGAVDSFEWTPPDSEDELKFVCRSWSRSIDHAGLYSISAVFQEVFEP